MGRRLAYILPSGGTSSWSHDAQRVLILFICSAVLVLL